MGFPGYFLIVQDFINWGKNNGVPVGPGGAGSLVASRLGITDLDPIRYDLRSSASESGGCPCPTSISTSARTTANASSTTSRKIRARAVSQIATFGTLGAKAVVRAPGAGHALYVLRRPVQADPVQPDGSWSLERTLKDEPAFKGYEQEEEVRGLVDLAKPLEGLTRNIGMHAGGVLIAPAS